MTATGVHQWFPRGRLLIVGMAPLYAAFAVWNLLDAQGAMDVVFGVALLAATAFLVTSTLAYRVQADERGLHLRGAWWRTRTVAWADVADLGRRSRWWGSPLVVTTHDGRRMSTGLRAVDHPSLVEHWRERTARTLEPA